MDFHISNASKKAFHATQLAIVLAYIITSRVCSGQVSVTVGSVEGKGNIDAVEGEEVLLMCLYEPEAGHVINSVRLLQWKKGDTDAGSDSIGSVNAAGDVNYNAPYSEPAYVISTTDVNKGLNLTIQNVSVTDNGTYRCLVSVRDPTINNYVGTGVLSTHANVAPTIIQLFDEDGKGLNNNDVVTLDPQRVSYGFTCKVPGIYPGIASFRWTVGTENLSGMDLPDEEQNGLITSSSNVTVQPKEEYDGQRLQCEALDKDGKVTVSVAVVLDTSGPPASTTPESTNASTTIGGPGPSAPKEVSTTGTTTMVSTSTDPPTPGSTTWMVIGGTDQRILITDEVDRGGYFGTTETKGKLASDGLTTGQIVGICVGAVALVAILLVLTLCIFCRESLSQQCSCLQCKSSVNPEKEGGTTDKEALELNGGSTSNKEKEEG